MSYRTPDHVKQDGHNTKTFWDDNGNAVAYLTVMYQWILDNLDRPVKDVFFNETVGPDQNVYLDGHGEVTWPRALTGTRVILSTGRIQDNLGFQEGFVCDGISCVPQPLDQNDPQADTIVLQNQQSFWVGFGGADPETSGVDVQDDLVVRCLGFAYYDQIASPPYSTPISDAKCYQY